MFGLFSGFFGSDAVTEDIKTYTVSSDIKSLEVKINAADFTIKQGDSFSVESNLKYLTVEDKNGVLTIRDTKKLIRTYTGAVLTLYIPADTVFDKANITTGAGKITISGGALHNLDLDMGAGQLNLTSALTGESDFDLGVGESNITVIGNKNDYKLDIEKGLGNITVDGTSVSNIKGQGNGNNDIEISGGIGAINLKFGKSDI